MDKKIPIKKGDVITLEILRKNTQINQSSAPQHKGIIFPHADDYPARRKKPNGLTLVDVGYLQGEPFSDLLFVSAPALANSYAAPLRNVNSDDYEALNDFVFGLAALADFSSTFSQIKKIQGDVYDLRISNGSTTEIINGSSDYWNDKDQISLPNDFLAGSSFEIICPNNFFEGIKLKGSGRNKITENLDFGAADFPGFTPTKNMIVYLMPVINISAGFADLRVSGVLRKYKLNYFYTIHNRNLYFDVDDPLFGNVPFGGWFYGFNDSDHYRDVWQAIEIAQAKPTPRAFYNSFSDPTIVTIDPDDFPPDPPYPPFPSLPVGDGSGGGDGEAIFLSCDLAKAVDGSGHIPDEALLAVIKQNSNYFYVWKDTV